MKSCIACSMPISRPEDFGAEISDGALCVHCVNSDGKMKSCDEIFEGGVEFFMASVDSMDKALAERLVRKNMNKLPYWQANKCACLEGEEASDEEFKNAISKISHD